MNNCNGNHSAKAPCDDPACAKSGERLAEEAAARAPLELEASQENGVTMLCLLLARFLGLLQRTLGRGQTHLLSMAWSWGWRPGTPEKLAQLRKRLVGLEVRAAMKKLSRSQDELKRQEAKTEKRFHKTYGEAGK